MESQNRLSGAVLVILTHYKYNDHLLPVEVEVKATVAALTNAFCIDNMQKNSQNTTFVHYLSNNLQRIHIQASK